MEMDHNKQASHEQEFKDSSSLSGNEKSRLALGQTGLRALKFSFDLIVDFGNCFQVSVDGFYLSIT